MNTKRFSFPALIHGADYNPDQWLHVDGIIEEDIRLMKLAGFNAVSLGIFAWSALEPEEGRYELDWMAKVIDALYAEGIYTILATPSGARPAWLARKYPEVLRVNKDGVRRKFGERHNHCYTAPSYRKKTAEINRVLSERFGKHPGVILWHISNEFGGECYCPLCVDAFRNWLKNKYGSLDALNHAWWNAFWSHTYSDWSEIEAPFSHGETMVMGMTLDWKRFVTYQTTDFMRAEIEAIRSTGSVLPVTTNFMGTFDGLNYWEMAKELDVISWDSYPAWHGQGPKSDPWSDWDEEGRDWVLASRIAFLHDLNRSFKQAPFLLMESTPSTTNWQPVGKLKRPGMHALSSIQAVAHGSDSVQYFQWRKSRGSMEKFHGAVVDHVGHEHTRVFRDVADLGKDLSSLSEVSGSDVKVEVAVLFDWENRWAIEAAAGPRNDGHKQYKEDCLAHYFQLWKQNIAVDIVDHTVDFSSYKLIIAPMLYMVTEETARKLEAAVNSGAVLVCTYWSGIVDEHDLCHLGGFPGPLKKLLGIWSEEIDSLYDGEERSFTMKDNNALGMQGSYSLHHFWERVHPEGAEVLATFDQEFLAGLPALTCKHVGKGKAYYIASRNEASFLQKFYAALAKDISLKKAWPEELPEGVSVVCRFKDEKRWFFVMNFSGTVQQIPVPESFVSSDIIVGKVQGTSLLLDPWDYSVLYQS